MIEIHDSNFVQEEFQDLIDYLEAFFIMQKLDDYKPLCHINKGSGLFSSSYILSAQILGVPSGKIRGFQISLNKGYKISTINIHINYNEEFNSHKIVGKLKKAGVKSWVKTKHKNNCHAYKIHLSNYMDIIKIFEAFNEYMA